MAQIEFLASEEILVSDSVILSLEEQHPEIFEKLDEVQELASTMWGLEDELEEARAAYEDARDEMEAMIDRVEATEGAEAAAALREHHQISEEL